ncbi:MAG: hypothetical protein WCD81_02120 [Candidatus Bathyarchaeia archaeon]
MAVDLHDLFVNREDCYCQQNKDGSYSRIAEPLTFQQLNDHLQGRKTVGSYQLGTDNTVKYLCFDFDPEKLKEPKTTVLKLLPVIFEVKEEEGTPKPRIWPSAVMLEASRYSDPSFHVWIFFAPAVDAKVAQWLGYRILELSNLNPKEVEVFPKQTELTEDRPYGNFVKLPLGLHQKEQKWSRILDHEAWTPLPNTYLSDFQGISFSEADIARILSLKQKSNVQAMFNLPKTFKPLSNREEEKSVAFLCKYWIHGYRNDLEMYFLGFCLRKGVSIESARRIIEEVVLRTGDDQRAIRLASVDYHYQNRLKRCLKGISGIREVVQEIKKHGLH